jgi:hypothetical protein
MLVVSKKVQKSTFCPELVEYGLFLACGKHETKPKLDSFTTQLSYILGYRHHIPKPCAVPNSNSSSARIHKALFPAVLQCMMFGLRRISSRFAPEEHIHKPRSWAALLHHIAHGGYFEDYINTALGNC